MIKDVLPSQYPELLDVQTECIRGLGDAYSQEEIDTGLAILSAPRHNVLLSFKIERGLVNKMSSKVLFHGRKASLLGWSQ